MSFFPSQPQKPLDTPQNTLPNSKEDAQDHHHEPDIPHEAHEQPLYRKPEPAPQPAEPPAARLEHRLHGVDDVLNLQGLAERQVAADLVRLVGSLAGHLGQVVGNMRADFPDTRAQSVDSLVPEVVGRGLPSLAPRLDGHAEGLRGEGIHFTEGPLLVVKLESDLDLVGGEPGDVRPGNVAGLLLGGGFVQGEVLLAKRLVLLVCAAVHLHGHDARAEYQSPHPSDFALRKLHRAAVQATIRNRPLVAQRASMLVILVAERNG